MITLIYNDKEMWMHGTGQEILEYLQRLAEIYGKDIPVAELLKKDLPKPDSNPISYGE